MGNSATANIKGEGDVILKMTFEKELKLTNVLYVPEIRKNLVSGWLLNKFDFHLVFESDKFVLSKNQMYVGRGYAMNGMFKLNVMVVKNEINKMNSSAYLIESSNVWHSRFGHPNGIAEGSNRTLKEMVTAMLISSGISQDMWGEAILTATYLLNKIPRKENGRGPPYELWMEENHHILFRVWVVSKVAVPTPKAQKIGPKSVDCIFIGYAKNNTAYRFKDHESKILISKRINNGL
ncbi:retrovirus-related pol polyprotein from transposon TNT 1-94 [Tanacetum coccineum]